MFLRNVFFSGILFASMSLFAQSSNATALTPVNLCDGCSSAQMEAKAKTSGNATFGAGGLTAYVGNRTTGQLRAYTLSMTPIWVYPMEWRATPTSVSDEFLTEFMTYSDAYREAGGATSIDVQIVTAAAQPSTLPSNFPKSGFDIVTDGPARQALINWAKVTDNWPSVVDRKVFHAKVIIENGVHLTTGQNFSIRLTFRFPDGSTTKMDYRSDIQSLVVVEVRDSQGNLIYTASKEPVQVDYSSYETHDAHRAADYSRGIGWLNTRGLIFVGSNGAINVRTGTVLVGSVVTVQE